MNNLLTPLQKTFLQALFADPIGQHFFLTGGTALAAFHLEHRLSDDLDLFTLSDIALQASVRSIDAISANIQCTLQRTRVTQYFHRLSLIHPQYDTPLQIDLVQDFGPQYGERIVREGITIDSLDNIAANKVTAIFGRADVKDFVDLYFILQAGYDLDELFAKAQEKDTGLTEFYFVGMLQQIDKQTRLPNMIKPLDMETLQAFYAAMAQRLMSRLNPER